MGKIAGRSQPIPLMGASAQARVDHNLKGVVLVQGGRAVTEYPDLVYQSPPRIFINALLMPQFPSEGASEGDTFTAAIVPSNTTLKVVRIGPAHPPWGGGMLV